MAGRGRVVVVLTELRAARRLPDLEALRQRFLPPRVAEPPPIVALIPDATTYDLLLSRI